MSRQIADTQAAPQARVAEAGEYGITGIHEGLISTPEVLFGCIKESSLGPQGQPSRHR
jgi:hypothetical protein